MATERLSLVEWMGTRLRIEPKDPTVRGGLVPLILNDSQILILSAALKQRNSGLPVKLIILKARQLGCTTGIAGWLFLNAISASGINSLVAAHKDDAGWSIYRKYLRFHKNLPEEEQRVTEYSSKKELIFAPPLDSRIAVQTAGALDLGRGDTYQQAHFSEVAWWPNASETMNSAQQTIPDSSGSVEIWESTANGLGGLFYDTWQTAVKHRRLHPDSLEGFTPLFLPWTLNPEYQRTVPSDVRVKKMIRGLTREQCYWRQRTLIDKCQNDEDLFMQEYPLTPDEAFRTSGRGIFKLAAIKHYRQRVREPRYVTMTADGPRQVDEHINCWRMWCPAETNREYTLGADVMEGLLSNPSSTSSNADYHAATVLNRELLRIEAIWHGREDTDLFGQQCLLAAKFYNNAWASPEINGPGIAVLNAFKRANYENIYQRTRPDDYPDQEDKAQLGWRTTPLTRPLMVDDAIYVIRNRQLICFSEEFVDEMLTFIRNKVGKPIHMPGKKDDILFSFMIALQLHLRCPRAGGAFYQESTSDFDSSSGDVMGKIFPSHTFVGGCDDFDPTADVDEGVFTL